jgi:hypothetical protein
MARPGWGRKETRSQDPAPAPPTVIYSVLPSFILGFHGCDYAVAEKVLDKSEHLKFSQNQYDWLGSGIYFWENSPERAMEWALELARLRRISRPAVVGAVIDLGNCLNLLDSKYLRVVKHAHEDLVAASATAGIPLPRNKPLHGSRRLLLRDLDCAVINAVHRSGERRGLAPFDTVRSAFIEGNPLYRNSSFRTRNHIQVCVRSITCIKGYFRPLDEPATA